MANKIIFDTRAIAEYAERLEALGGNLKKSVDKALVESQKHITKNLHSDMAKHRRTGITESSIVEDETVKWAGMSAGIDVGFDLKNRGMPSIYLMHGTPRKKKDTKLYNDVYGTATKKEIKKIQDEVFQKAIDEQMGGR